MPPQRNENLMSTAAGNLVDCDLIFFPVPRNAFKLSTRVMNIYQGDKRSRYRRRRYRISVLTIDVVTKFCCYESLCIQPNLK